MTWVRPRADIQKALEIQRQALLSSSEAYDSGKKWEALRIATAVHIVVHDAGKKDKSILTQLGLKRRLRFGASGFQYSPRNVLRETHLLSMRIYGDGTAKYLPILDGRLQGMRWLQFHKWWEDDLIFRDGTFHLTRKKLTFILRSKEGGAHFDPILVDPNYLRFAQEQLTTPYVVKGDQPPTAILGAELASMRQIGWELVETLKALDSIP